MRGVPVLKADLAIATAGTVGARSGINAEPPTWQFPLRKTKSFSVASDCVGFCPPRKEQIYLDLK